MATIQARRQLTPELDVLVDRYRPLWEQLRGAQVFITGGTGFFGSWLLETLTFADERLSLRARVMVLTRRPDVFASTAPHLAGHPIVSVVQGDVRTFGTPGEKFSHIVHCAADASPAMNRERPDIMGETIVQGTERVLELVSHSPGARSLLASSGAVYGTQPPSVTHIAEDDESVAQPLAVPSAYAEGKRTAERLWRGADAGSIARGFAFLGPYFPIDGSFAISTFIADAINGRPIAIHGDGTARRSYMYGSDLAVWLWTILCHGAAGRAYNVGGEIDYSVLEVARLVAETRNPALPITVKQEPVPGRPVERYVPSTARAREELGLTASVDLKSGITRMLSWYSSRS